MTDLVENMLRQKTEEIDAAYHSNKILFIDTDALTTQFYANLLLNNTTEKSRCKALADAIADINRFDMVLFLEPTVDFVQDDTRNELIAQDREKYSQQIKQLFREHNIPFYSLKGTYLDRFNDAKSLISGELGITTIW